MLIQQKKSKKTKKHPPLDVDDDEELCPLPCSAFFRPGLIPEPRNKSIKDWEEIRELIQLWGCAGNAEMGETPRMETPRCFKKGVERGG